MTTRNPKGHGHFVRPLFLLVLASLIALPLGCDAPARLSPLAADAVILAFGDSITHGTGSAGFGTVDPKASYPAQLQTLIGRTVIESGIPGETSDTGLARLRETLPTLHPTLVILCHGGNDMLRNTPEAQIERNLRAMIQLIREADADVLLVAVPHPGFALRPAPLYDNVAKDLHVVLERDILATILADTTLKSDPLHPNARGYALLADAIARRLVEAGAVERPSQP
ncbi:lysophospholipase L1-like esterase [Desulfobaculum xiamenense]|uniref:Lysophospholipase L1-like esterase n=1 Tax=Desulfobaculum xiamenense TaxID=995050 RepID=A0A846QPF2_9BACT|nr:GDSL-type esterase/lipase family protein [Desulfobaculum xiamenense]NJB66589.1 lysophospholipase L1-like esterase [Desulfobaculum xiamenense]